tara:strand:- start:25171 stop:25500 length:330 start_codon:yes stop_codon:yes gene_type:complete
MKKQHGNELSQAQIERLAWLSEEFGEIQQAIGKILRHGYDSKDPTNPNHKGNRADLEREIGDAYTAIALMSNEGDLSLIRIMSSSHEMDLSKKYFHHQSWNKSPYEEIR